MEIIVEAKTRATQRYWQLIHLSAHRLVNDAGIDLRRGEFCVAEHFADWFNRHSIGVGYGSCESMAGKVESK